MFGRWKTRPGAWCFTECIAPAGWWSSGARFLINHFDLFGLRQVYLYLRGQPIHAARVPHTKSVSAGAAPALPRLADGLLGDADYDSGPSGFCVGDDRLHSHSHTIRRERPVAILRGNLPQLPTTNADDHPAAPRQGSNGRSNYEEGVCVEVQLTEHFPIRSPATLFF